MQITAAHAPMNRLLASCLAITFLLTCATHTVRAGDADSDEDFGSDKWAAKHCAEPKGEQEETVCVAYEYRRVDAKLNEAYKKLKALTPAGERGKLVADERAWIKQRDATCTAETSEVASEEESPGTAHLLYSGEWNSCLWRITKLRLGVLEANLKARSQSHIILSFAGVGPIKIGTSCARLTEAGYIGCPGRDRDGTDIVSAPCVDTGFLNKDPEANLPEKHLLPGFDAQLRYGRVQRIDVKSDANEANDFTVVTVDGIHLHSTEDEVRKVYRGRAQEGQASIYGITQLYARAGERHAFLLKSADGQRGLLVETGGGEVIAMHVGVIHDFYLMRANNEVTILAPKCAWILEGPPGGPASYP